MYLVELRNTEKTVCLEQKEQSRGLQEIRSKAAEKPMRPLWQLGRSHSFFPRIPFLSPPWAAIFLSSCLFFTWSSLPFPPSTAFVVLMAQKPTASRGSSGVCCLLLDENPPPHGPCQSGLLLPCHHTGAHHLCPYDELLSNPCPPDRGTQERLRIHCWALAPGFYPSWT